MSSAKMQTRERILEAARRLLERGGGATVHMRGIAAEAGVSRQAVYLHFGSRTELMVDLAHYVDGVTGLEERLAPVHAAARGVDRLEALVAFIDDHFTAVYSVAKALLRMRDADEAAAAAIDDRLNAVREECRAAVEALYRDDALTPAWTIEEATDILWTLLSIPAWEQLTQQCGWPHDAYVGRMTTLARRVLVSD